VTHVDAEVLALVALGEPAASEADLAHLAACAQCGQNLRELTRAVQVGRATSDIEVLDQPDAAVWAAIEQRVAAGASTPVALVSPLDGARTVGGRPSARRTTSRMAARLVAAAIIVVLAVGGIVAWNSLRPVPATTVAATKLDSLPAWRGTASGSAVLVQFAGGVRKLTINLSVPASAKYRQAWLMTPDLKHFIRIGSVDGSVTTLDIPKNADLGRYNVVDISDEPASTVAQPSDNSIVRGTLPPLVKDQSP